MNTPASREQLYALLDFLEQHKDLARGRLRNNMDRMKAMLLWKEITQKLNSMGGSVKAEEQWKKIWCDKKYLARKNFQAFRSAANVGDKQIPLCETDMKVLSILYEDSEGTGQRAHGALDPVPSCSQKKIHSQCGISAENTQTYVKLTDNARSMPKAFHEEPPTSNQKQFFKPEENKQNGGKTQKEIAVESVKEKQRPIEMEISEIVVERNNDIVEKEIVAKKDVKSNLKEKVMKKKRHVDNFATTTEMLRYFEQRSEQTERKFINELKDIGSTLKELLELLKHFKGEPTD